LKAESFFLPYQIEWLENTSKIKIWEKSRRIGATYIQAFEDVMDCVRKRVPKVWFSSADMTAAEEYIQYCEKWAKVVNAVASRTADEIIDENKGIKKFTLEFSNGTEIHALSSNPKGFRSKGGKVVLDEFAFHEDADEMWRAAFPVATWGFPIVILSTHNGKNCKFYKFLEQIQAGKLDWYHQKTDIYTAVEQGLADKILGRPLTKKEREAWIQEQRDLCNDDIAWAQEYETYPADEATAFLTYDLIKEVERNNILTDLSEVEGDLFLGMDVARKRHLTIIWIIEKIGLQKITRKIEALQDMRFRDQKELLYLYLNHPKLRRACIDDGGLGMQLAEDAQIDFGKFKVEPVRFTQTVKEDLAYQLRNSIEDIGFIIPPDPKIRDDFHSVRKLTTASGNIRFDAIATGNGHADRFWAAALSNHACSGNPGPVTVQSRKKRQSLKITEGY
jgi:phage FluMu gp28-like protein